MKLGKSAYVRTSKVIKYVIERALRTVLKHHEVQVSVNIKPIKEHVNTVEPYNKRSMYNPKVHVSE